MKFSVSNIGLSAYDHADQLKQLPEMGFEGLEVGLSRVWKDNWNDPSAAQVDTYRHEIEASGLCVVGLHSLFWQRPELSLFGTADTVAKTADFLVGLSKLCRDLGGRTLIYGSQTARTRGNLSLKEANTQATDFFADLCRRVEDHGTCFCFEPLETEVADYINSALESLAVVKAVNHPALQVQIDAKALAANGEADPATIRAVADHLVHVHVNEPGLNVLGSSGKVDHAALGTMLCDIDYQGFVSIEQRQFNDSDPLVDIAKSADHLKECYG